MGFFCDVRGSDHDDLTVPMIDDSFGSGAADFVDFGISSYQFLTSFDRCHNDELKYDSGRYFCATVRRVTAKLYFYF